MAVMDDEAQAAIRATVQALRFFTPGEAAAQLLPPAFGGVVPEAVKKALQQNYGR